MKSFGVKLWNAVKPQIGKIVSFIVGAAVSAAGMGFSEQNAQDLSCLVNGLIN